MTYDNLITIACNLIPEVKAEYERQVKNGIIDAESGQHIAFSYVFSPVMVEAVKKNMDLADKMFDFVELMETNEDKEIGEVADFSILEVLADTFSDAELIPLMGNQTKEAFKYIRDYIPD